jgi:hypothetical protein
MKRINSLICLFNGGACACALVALLLTDWVPSIESIAVVAFAGAGQAFLLAYRSDQ